MNKKEMTPSSPAPAEPVLVRFECKVRSRKDPSKIDTVKVEARHLEEAIGKLLSDGYLIVDIQNFSRGISKSSPAVRSKIPQSAKPGSEKPAEEPRTVRKKVPLIKSVSNRELISFAVQLSALIKSGIPLLKGLKIIQKGNRNLYFDLVLDDIIDNVSQGFSFNHAVSQNTRVFPPVWVNLIEVGEVSGTLAEVLEEIARYQESSERIKSKVVSALFYPGVISVLAMGAVIFLLYTIIPKFEPIFEQMHLDLPILTRVVLGISKSLRSYGLWIALAFGGFLFGLYTLVRTKSGRYFIDWLLLKMPVFGTLLMQVGTVRFTRALCTLLTSGIQILQALKIAAKLTENTVLTKIVNDAHDAVEEGHGLSQQLEASKFFPVFMTQLIGVGEESGELVRFMTLIGNYYEERIDNFLTRLSSLLEPVMLVFVGSIIGVIVISIFLPLLEVSTHAGQG